MSILDIVDGLKSKLPTKRHRGILDDPPVKPKRTTKVLYGELYHGVRVSSRELAAQFGITYAAFRQQMATGITPEELEAKLNAKRDGVVKYTYLGNDYTIEELAKHPDCVVGRQSLRHRLKAGWDTSLAVTTPAGSKYVTKSS